MSTSQQTQTFTSEQDTDRIYEDNVAKNNPCADGYDTFTHVRRAGIYYCARG